MTRTRILWLAALLLAIAVLLTIRDRAATGSRAPEAGTRAAHVDGATAATSTGRVAGDDGDDGAARDALATLRAYVALLPADLARADAHWAGGAPAHDACEADLRALPAPPDRFRLTSRAAEAFAGTPASDEVRIPVELRLDYRDQPARLYRGWYRLRAKAGGGWEITGAAVDAVPARQ